MPIVKLSEISEIDLNFSDLEIYPESWTKRKSFSQYEKTPRSCSALFLVCTDIRVTFTPKEGAPITASQGDLVWIPMGALYYVEVEGGTEARIDTYTLNFHLYDPQNEDILLCDTITILAKEENKLFEMHIERLSSEVHRVEDGSNKRKNFLQIKANFYSLLDALSRTVSKKETRYYPIRAGVEAINNEWNRNTPIEHYASLCGVSETYFYRCFRGFSGKSPVEYRNMLRLSNAETMLRQTNMKIGEIAQTVGFEDPFYFCRIFSGYFGISPKEYRKKFLSL